MAHTVKSGIDMIGPTPFLQIRRASGGGEKVQPASPMEEERRGHHPYKVFHLFRSHIYEPSWCFGQDLQGRLGARVSRRHRDWTGPAHQDDTGRSFAPFLSHLPFSDEQQVSPSGGESGARG